MIRITPAEREASINKIQDVEVLKLRDQLLPLVKLKEILSMNDLEKDFSEEDKNKILKILILSSGKSFFGNLIDDVENMEEIVVKPLPKILKKMKYFSGSSIRGDGTVSLILDIAGIVEDMSIDRLDLQEVKRMSILHPKVRAICKPCFFSIIIPKNVLLCLWN